MKNWLSEYKTLIFDCDGVILNSNRVKTQAFFEASKKYGDKPAQALVDYHVKNGGISRFKKFEYLFTNILQRPFTEYELNIVLNDYAEIVKKALLECDIAQGLKKLRQLTYSSKWIVASGGAQTELRDVFRQRNIESYFDGGIYGSPTAKDDIIQEQLVNNNIETPALFLGDSRYDHVVADKFNFDFVFITKWSEFADLDDYADRHGLKKVETLGDLTIL